MSLPALHSIPIWSFGCCSRFVFLNNFRKTQVDAPTVLNLKQSSTLRLKENVSFAVKFFGCGAGSGSSAGSKPVYLVSHPGRAGPGLGKHSSDRGTPPTPGTHHGSLTRPLAPAGLDCGGGRQRDTLRQVLLWLYLPRPNHFGGVLWRHRSPGFPSKPPFLPPPHPEAAR